MDFDKYERRQTLRRSYRQNLVFYDGSNGVRHYAGIAVDISDSGMGLLTFEEIAKGQELIFEKRLPVPYKKGVVLWVKKYLGTLHKLGVSFTG